MIYEKTPRLVLRALLPGDLDRLVALIGEWDVTRWMAVVPHPYRRTDAEKFLAEITPSYQQKAPEFFAIALNEAPGLIGGIGLHTQHRSNPQAGEAVLGYWLGKPYWGNGYMTEAATKVIEHAFARPDIHIISADTDPENMASENILRKLGMRRLGLVKRTYQTLKGPDEVRAWELTRGEYIAMANGSIITGTR